MSPFQSDRSDTDRCYSQFGPSLGRCAGGRFIVKGYVCPHCNSTNPREHCLAPKAVTESSEEGSKP